jgi:glycosyltransferase involved in cell wall biosynthesis
MNILIVCDSKMPVSPYDDKGRQAWWLGSALSEAGHTVTFLLREEVACSFAKILTMQDKKPISGQIPENTDIVHFHQEPKTDPGIPYLITLHENSMSPRTFDRNTVFLSHSHAQLHGGSVFVYPGMDFSAYTPPDFSAKRIWFHFLGSAAGKGRNIRGAIDVVKKAGGRLHVVGGTRVNFRQGFRIPLSPSARFHGLLSPDGRDSILNSSKGLIIPLLWQEPFSLSVVESLYYGCPVFGTPYGALPEQLGRKPQLRQGAFPASGSIEAYYSEYGSLSVKKAELIDAVRASGDFDQRQCYEYAVSRFSSRRMAEDYVKLYEQILTGLPLHKEAPATKGIEDNLLPLS